MEIMSFEIFGPVLPIIPYRDFAEVIKAVGMHKQPLALYYFGSNNENLSRLKSETLSGGITVNDVFLHLLQDDSPFGGVGKSGMGSYRGFEGFCSFSNSRSVFIQSKLDFTYLLKPPYKTFKVRMLDFLIGHI